MRWIRSNALMIATGVVVIGSLVGVGTLVLTMAERVDFNINRKVRVALRTQVEAINRSWSADLAKDIRSKAAQVSSSNRRMMTLTESGRLKAGRALQADVVAPGVALLDRLLRQAQSRLQLEA